MITSRDHAPREVQALPRRGARGALRGAVGTGAAYRAAGLCLVAGPTLFTLTWLVLGLVSPGFWLFGIWFGPYSPVSHPISGLGLGSTAVFMNTAFVLMGVLLMVGVLGLFRDIREIGTFARWSCVALLALTGVGAIVDGLFTLESFLAHFVGFGLGCGVPVVSFLVAGLVLRHVPRWRRLATGLLLGSPLTLVLLILSLSTFDQEAVAAGRGVAGLTERALITEVTFWFAALGWSALRERQPDPATVA